MGGQEGGSCRGGHGEAELTEGAGLCLLQGETKASPRLSLPVLFGELHEAPGAGRGAGIGGRAAVRVDTALEASTAAWATPLPPEVT